MKNIPKTKKIMVQGTASSVGKSVITAALCRIFFQDGMKVAPFKSQNMALNSFVTEDGGEMGRAQVVQAYAAKVTPDVSMNPILLKPTTDKKAQVIVNGKAITNMSAAVYHEYKKEAKVIIKEAFEKLESKYDTIVIEGAGSPAEINLRENDIVNMGLAEIIDTPVILVADIDRGGVFASIAGTFQLLPEEETDRIKGVVINKFRGDVKLLEPGLKMIEDIIKRPVLGVIPFIELDIEDEDSTKDNFNKLKRDGDILIEIILLPHVSNFTDFDVLCHYDDVNIKYVRKVNEMENPDIIIIPGSKNTIGDLIWLKNIGFDKEIISQSKKGTIVFGICGGFQMLGKTIGDPHGIESNVEIISGLGLLEISTSLDKEKITEQINCKVIMENDCTQGINGLELTGYEIHCGITNFDKNLTIFTDNNNSVIKDNIKKK